MQYLRAEMLLSEGLESWEEEEEWAQDWELLCLKHKEATDPGSTACTRTTLALREKVFLEPDR